MRRMKYTRAEKLKIVKEHLNEGISLNDLSKKYNYSTSIIKYQVQLYLLHGENIFKNSLDRTYTREEKLKVIERVYAGEAAHAIALEMGLSDPTTIRDWIKIYKTLGEDGIKDTHSREAYKHHDDKILEKEYKKLLEDLERTKAENAYLKKIISPNSQKKQTIKQKVMVVRELRGQYKFSLLLEIAGISKQEYYYVIKHEFDKDNKDKLYEDLILQIFNKNYQKYGSPRITEALNIEFKKRNLKPINHKKVERLMVKLGIQARPKQRKYVSYKGKIGKVAPNIINRDFSTTMPYEK